MYEHYLSSTVVPVLIVCAIALAVVFIICYFSCKSDKNKTE